MKTTNYTRKDMPALSEILDDIRSQPGAWRVRIAPGVPLYYHHNHYLKHVHANVRYKNGVETFRSKHLTDNLLDKPVARTSLDHEHQSALVQIFMPYGRRKQRKPGPPAEGFIPIGPGEYIPEPPDFDDDLPFN